MSQGFYYYSQRVLSLRSLSSRVRNSVAGAKTAVMHIHCFYPSIGQWRCLKSLYQTLLKRPKSFIQRHEKEMTCWKLSRLLSWSFNSWRNLSRKAENYEKRNLVFVSTTYKVVRCDALQISAWVKKLRDGKGRQGLALSTVQTTRMLWVFILLAGGVWVSVLVAQISSLLRVLLGWIRVLQT